MSITRYRSDAGLATRGGVSTRPSTLAGYGITDAASSEQLSEETGPILIQLDAHENDTTAVHGIADTANLVLTSDSRLTNARTPTAHALNSTSFHTGTADFSQLPTGTGNWPTTGLGIGTASPNLGGSCRAVTVANQSANWPELQMHANSDSITAGVEVGRLSMWAGSASPKEIAAIGFTSVDTGEDDGTIRFYTALANTLSERASITNGGTFVIEGPLDHNGSTVGLYGVTPVARAAAIAAPTGGVVTDAEARTAINAIRTALANIGITS